MEAPAEPQEDQAGRSSLGVLIVDDDDDMRFLTTKAVERLDSARRFRLLQAASGPEALAVVEREASGSRLLVLCDQRMPGMNGDEVATRLKEEHDARVTFVLLTSVAPDWDRADLRRAGIDQVIEKPLRAREWQERLAALLDLWADEAPVRHRLA